MDSYVIYEIIGYIASVLIAVSLMMSVIIKLRIINMIGAATFCLYGLLIGATPVAAMNGFIVLINAYYLIGILGDKEYFKLLRVPVDSDYLNAFLDFYKDEIRKYQPEFNLVPDKNDICIFIHRDMVPAGLVIGTADSDGNFTIKVDFAIPNYRDFKVSGYLFNGRKDFLEKLGIQKLVTCAEKQKHREYLEKTGFKKSESVQGRYEKAL